MYIGSCGPSLGLTVGKLCTLVYMVLVEALYGNGSYVHWFMCPIIVILENIIGTFFFLKNNYPEIRLIR